MLMPFLCHIWLLRCDKESRKVAQPVRKRKCTEVKFALLKPGSAGIRCPIDKPIYMYSLPQTNIYRFQDTNNTQPGGRFNTLTRNKAPLHSNKHKSHHQELHYPKVQVYSDHLNREPLWEIQSGSDIFRALVGSTNGEGNVLDVAGRNSTRGVLLAAWVDIIVGEGVTLAVRLVLVDESAVVVGGVDLVVLRLAELGLNITAGKEES